jgi:hypothetical protein
MAARKVLLDVMRDEKHDIQLRVIAAKAAAPYVHRALKSVEQTGADGGPQRIVVSWQDPGAWTCIATALWSPGHGCA